ncbi:tripartite tricarboxylate transporter substrate-binding protein [Bradyrhizobium sp. cir1]|uniref:tripartite tricarboxylate transporter substrate-binding protein n=1 Tax=Bradyrhizobium sp. cir1 TaxID=1445730 RepID=UPI003907F917
MRETQTARRNPPLCCPRKKGNGGLHCADCAARIRQANPPYETSLTRSPASRTSCSGNRGMIESAAWLALLAPANTDKTVVDKLYKAMVEAVNDPKVRALFVEQGAEPLVMAPKGLTDYMTAETTKWAAIIKQIGIEPM